MNYWLYRLLPFLNWFPISGKQLRADVVAGISVTMILVPQGMAYATLAGLPVIYGLYASAIPAIIGSLWGSSRFLHTGPVAMISLLSAASLAPFAAAGTQYFIELSILLALMVGVMRLLLGIFRLGILMNFVSQPVIIGFTNAAALIIGLSLLNTFLSVPKPDSGTFLEDFFGVVAQIPHAHWPTVAFGVGTLVALVGLRYLMPRLPGVLVVVILGTLISALIGFERNETVDIEQVQGDPVEGIYHGLLAARQDLDRVIQTLNEASEALQSSEDAGVHPPELAVRVATLESEKKRLSKARNALRLEAHRQQLTRRDHPTLGSVFQPREAGDAGPVWRLSGFEGNRLIMASGGQVVGTIPQGLPSIQAPVLHWDVMPALLPAAFVMALIGFMEATAISRALAARRREKLNPNQELIGQGLANIVGSFFQSFSVSGSFSRSAVAARSGAQTGMFAIISAIGVLITMLYLTPWLYHLPQAVLAAIVMSAVFGLVDFRTMAQYWSIRRADGLAGFITFGVTLLMAPNLANGVIVGALMANLVFLAGTVRPRYEIQSLRSDGTRPGSIRDDAEGEDEEPAAEDFAILRFDASLVFMNTAHFEDAVMDALARNPNARALLVVGNSLNRIDASGIDKIRSLITDLQAADCTLMFSGLKPGVLKYMKRAGLLDEIGEKNIFGSYREALETLQPHRKRTP
ncbi:SulP family inorganic anion transporter [Ectothiorhodospira marina]|uniref:Sulfate permease, SulP family n=1 Tax=Ectothiorhodospira marina TaxID=1396821 RepID=A0A1H7JVC9_9GAMM|nr:SulP family inorganic anion transporter [Ectothiorhodospira marina]SEK78568.1 sulfate permease, SulP family [Ectothiorhodospira marina]